MTMTNDLWARREAQEDWLRVRRKAFVQAAVDRLAGRPRELVPLQEVRARLPIGGGHYRGLQHVPLSKIVGSEGRYTDFDRHFLPRQDHVEQRWQRVDMARYEAVSLPPVELYKIGDVYFVKDGNHRVSVARAHGLEEIDAYVTEYTIDVPLEEPLTVRDLLIKEEYSDFLEWTQLHRLRPQQRIEFSALGGYLELIEHINTHRYYLSQERGEEVSVEEAVTSWYDNVYMPLVELIRQHGILSQFPGRTEADLYLWIMQHRYELQQTSGVEPSLEVAALDYAAQFGHRSILETVGGAVRSLASGARAVPTPPPATPPLEPLNFLEWSGINHLCPDADVRLSSNDYSRLREHILAHRYFLSQERGYEVSLEEAVQHWCTEWYMPVVQAIRQSSALAHFPGRTETDLYLWIMDHLHYRKQEGQPVDIAPAIAEYVEQYGTGNRARVALEQLINRVRQRLGVVIGITDKPRFKRRILSVHHLLLILSRPFQWLWRVIRIVFSALASLKQFLGRVPRRLGLGKR
jgi:hypothetical protein